jgi:putative solute:sodium symporter small subunit
MSERPRMNRSEMNVDENRVALRAYWTRTIRFTLALLAVWFVVGYLAAIVFAPWLNQFTFLGGPLGFWFAQNGAIYIFWLLILIYALGMNRLDHEFDVEE